VQVEVWCAANETAARNIHCLLQLPLRRLDRVAEGVNEPPQRVGHHRLCNLRIRIDTSHELWVDQLKLSGKHQRIVVDNSRPKAPLIGTGCVIHGFHHI
jgi:hypothetical protein